MKHAELSLLKTKNVPPAQFDFSGHWVNELKSYMDLTVTGSDVSGKYVSAVSETGGPTPPFPLRGSVAGDLISFTVNWGEAITTWVGHGVMSNGAPQILTLWHLVLTIQDETNPQEQWKTVMAGADEFTR
jgi:hypothetical protein